MGSNMAEAHPVGFRWPMKAKARGAKLIHVDPRFTRTSALCDRHVQIRAGSDIAFLGAIINYILQNDLWFKEYVMAYTNASFIIDPEYRDTDEMGGMFSGFNKQTGEYDGATGNWGYKGSVGENEQHEKETKQQKTSAKPQGAGQSGQQNSGASQGVHGYAVMGGASSHNKPQDALVTMPDGEGDDEGKPYSDPTLQDPNCAMNVMKRHFQRYTFEMAAEICGCAPEQIKAVADMLVAASGPDKTAALCYAVGWTQHTTGVQIIRAASILQLLLGNMGRPGGGIMALRGHCTIQGSTDVPTLYDSLPGYIPQPAAEEHHETIDEFVKYESFSKGYWANQKKFVVSMMKAWYGDVAQKENDYCWKWLPRVDDDHSMLPYFDKMSKGEKTGYFMLGQNPAAGGPNAGLVRAGLRKLKWLVVADWFETDTATFWKNDPKGPPPEDIGTEVFFIPAATVVEKEGSFTNTQRLIQWHDKAIDPPGDCRSDAWFIYNLGKRLKAMYAGSTDPKDDPIKALTWDYDEDEPKVLPDGSVSKVEGEPDINKIAAEINGWHVKEIDPETQKPKLLTGFSELKDDGSTACGCWIYSGIMPKPGYNRARERTITNNSVQPNWGYAWPNNRRVMYNRASAKPDGTPWSEAKKLIWWDAEKKHWVGDDVPDWEPDKDPAYRPKKDSKGMEAISGADAFLMKPDGRAWLYAPGGTKDGPLPAHYEPAESPVANVLYHRTASAPSTRYMESQLNPVAHPPSPEFPVVACTFRVTEQYLSGPMSRFNSWLNELMPAMFVEISPELAGEHGIENGGWMSVTSARGTISARALVTRRQKPMTVLGQLVHQIGIPFHWGYAGETVGGVANDLTSLVADPNVSMHEAKVFACRVSSGLSKGTQTEPTVPYEPWANREDVPETPKSAQPEGHMHKSL